MKYLTAIFLVLITLAGLLLKDASTIALDHIDLLVMFNDRHTSRIVDQIVRDQFEAAEAFHEGLIQGMEDVNEKYRGGKDH